MAEPTVLTDLSVLRAVLSVIRKECTELHGAVECTIPEWALTVDSTDLTADFQVA